MQLRQRKLHEATRAAFASSQYEEVITLALKTELVSTELLTLSMKSHYRLRQYQQCISVSQQLLDINEQDEDAAYFKASSLARIHDYAEGMKTLKDCMSVIPTVSNHSFLLYGYMCFRAVPPQYEVAVDSFTEVINRNKRDFEAVRTTETHCRLNLTILPSSCFIELVHTAVYRNGQV